MYRKIENEVELGMSGEASITVSTTAQRSRENATCSAPERPSNETPIEEKEKGEIEQLSSARETFGNIFIAFVGAGILGLPHAFRRSGLVLGACFILTVAAMALHCMLLLIKCKRRLEGSGVVSYSGVAGHCCGRGMQVCVEILLILTQVGFCVGYLVFIGQNMKSMDFMPESYHIYGGVPILVCLAMIRSLTALAPFSILADVANVLGIIVVVYHDLADGVVKEHEPTMVGSIRSLPFMFGVSMYCFEGFGMILPIEQAMQDRSQFEGVMTMSMATITVLFVSFGMLGYAAYGDETQDIITLNLPKDWTASAVKIFLCLGLFFTFPVMMVPVYEIVEENLMGVPWIQGQLSPAGRRNIFNIVRAFLVLFAAFCAASVPGFGIFISLVGSLCCALLAFVFPALFHMRVFKEEMPAWEWYTDLGFIVFGVLGAIIGVSDAIAQ
ncbi:hypothetical protein CYMTET_31666, partial [Cymbomonas tetramitiformis]